MNFQDKELTCADCGEIFVFTARDQEFYSTKGFSDPKRCYGCRRARKAQKERRGDGDGGYREREEFEVVCAECGTLTKVPFEPRANRPVYCRECFNARRKPSRNPRG